MKEFHDIGVGLEFAFCVVFPALVLAIALVAHLRARHQDRPDRSSDTP